MLEVPDAFLDAKRMRGDAVADEVALRLMRGGAVAEVDGLFKALQRNVMSQGGLTPGGHGRGIRSAQKVRLVHGMLRARLTDQGWDSEAFGVPINQEDLAGTMLAFSVVITEGLKMLNVDLTDAQVENLLAALPQRTRAGHPVRDLFTVVWDTGLRHRPRVRALGLPEGYSGGRPPRSG